MKKIVFFNIFLIFIISCGSPKKEVNLGGQTKDIVLASGKSELASFYQEFSQKIADKFYSPYYNEAVDLFVFDFRNDTGNTTILSRLFSDFLIEKVSRMKGLRITEKTSKAKAYSMLNLSHIDFVTTDLCTTLLKEYGAEIIIDGEVSFMKDNEKRIVNLILRAYEAKSGIKILGVDKKFNFDLIAKTMDLELYLQTILIKKQMLKIGRLRITQETKLGQLNNLPTPNTAENSRPSFANVYINEEKILSSMKIESRVTLDNHDFYPDEQGYIFDKSLKSGPYEVVNVFTISFPFENNLIYKKKEARFLIEVNHGEELSIHIENIIEQPEPTIRMKGIVTKSVPGTKGTILIKEAVELKELAVTPQSK
jgi:hypothetical protein